LQRIWASIVAGIGGAILGSVAPMVIARQQIIPVDLGPHTGRIFSVAGFVIAFVLGSRSKAKESIDPTRIRGSAALLAIGLITVAVGIQQLSTTSPSIGSPAAFALFFLGGTLVGAGALCPFHRTTAGTLWGFSFPLVILLCM
jgi:hypothetical protein